MVVRGIYHREGKQGGREYDDFIATPGSSFRNLFLGPTGGLP